MFTAFLWNGSRKGNKLDRYAIESGNNTLLFCILGLSWLLQISLFFFEGISWAKGYLLVLLKIEVCVNFVAPHLNFLGFVVVSNELRPDPDKVLAILSYPTPKTTTEIKQLIGLIS